jgi:hypothetical protein
MAKLRTERKFACRKMHCHLTLSERSDTNFYTRSTPEGFLPIATILVAVFVLQADFHSMPSPILIVITPAAISIRSVIIWSHAPTATYRPAIRVHHLSFHPVHHSPHVVVAHASHSVAVAWTRSPTGTDLTVLSSISIFLTRLVRLLGAPLRLHGNSLGLAWTSRLHLVLAE